LLAHTSYFASLRFASTMNAASAKPGRA
jgi:hypothetical protein